ncbi:hypothetical protein SN811_22090 [Ligilactobacillus agilis]|uniref:Uncharacterized protein n=1 Tax=Ligilactobacillus agilis TaxID=1601 RepID=A0A6F9Y865_9LACO|nr:hypothetical protein [Ligilactobacillus agilis]GET13709.1 hypothetical protein SN811_22090 [Ligilactobacillus agilis]
MPKKIHDLADELGIKLDTLRKQIYKNTYLGKHSLYDTDTGEFYNFNITDADIEMKIENGKRTKYLSDNLCKLIRLTYYLREETKRIVAESAEDGQAYLRAEAISAHIKEYVDSDKLTANKKTRIANELNKLTEIVKTQENLNENFYELLSKIEAVFDYKYGRVEPSVMPSLTFVYTTWKQIYVNKFNDWKNGDYQEFDKLIKDYEKLRSKYTAMNNENN